MKIIGHRGAAGVALENSLQSIKAALASDVDAVEFDIWMTADEQFILCHDADITAMTGKNLIIAGSTMAELLAVPLRNGERFVSLSESIEAITDKPIVMDVKGMGWATALARALSTVDSHKVVIISFNHAELVKFHALAPKFDTYALGGKTALQAIYTAIKHDLTGIDINHRVMNPLFYLIAKIWRLEVIAYTVNHRIFKKIYKLLYPAMAITTDYPSRFID